MKELEQELDPQLFVRVHRIAIRILSKLATNQEAVSILVLDNGQELKEAVAIHKGKQVALIPTRNILIQRIKPVAIALKISHLEQLNNEIFCLLSARFYCLKIDYLIADWYNSGSKFYKLKTKKAQLLSFFNENFNRLNKHLHSVCCTNRFHCITVS